MTTIALTIALSALLAQLPNPAAAINAAKDARARTEAAQKKNAEALDQKPAPPPPPGAPVAPAAPAPQAASGTPPQPPAPPATGAGYSYDPAGRRDPFVSLTARGGELPSAGARPSGPAGLLVNEITVKGVLKSAKGGFIALVQAPDNRTYLMRAGDKVFDGTVKAITQDAVVFSQDVNDPLSLVKQREVRKAIRPEAR
jgi:Tfp pilus assembly protein PilP